MRISARARRPFGALGIDVPPIVFGTAALANVPDAIPEQRKLEICGEWFRQVEPPVFVDVACDQDNGLGLEVLARTLRRLDVASEDVRIHLTVESRRVVESWERGCQLLGSDYRPKLLSVCDAAPEPWRAVGELKQSGEVRGVGLVSYDFCAIPRLEPPADWLVLSAGLSLMHHPADLLEFMAGLAGRQTPIIVSDVFAGGFLIGGNRLHGRAIDANDPANRSALAWRTSFAALCHGHGVTPAQACIQFALSAPGVVAVRLDASHPDRVRENVESVVRKVPDAFWAAMKEEGLLGEYPCVGK
jgi:D-threo-aldose 1-dehydrogenase